jgi:CTD small phosphatase-like protein 2
MIIFDLDETLVHCLEDHLTSDTAIEIKLPSGEHIKAGLNIRPFARECLLNASQNFEVAVFTASHQCYADVVLDYLDPTNTLIQHRLYRDNCVQVEGLYTKDLRIFKNWSLSELILVDNAAYSFAN